MPVAVEVNDVSKRFRIGDEKVRSLKEKVIKFRRHHYQDFWALREVGFTVEQGETVGLLGHNGSGKSTLLKLIGGIMQPTTGDIRVRGRLASLLELGAGFHPDLTGRENVFLNASILGMSRKETEARFDEIVEFSELEQFIDLQVKHYSSGMYVRLGFAVAVNVDPDVLLVDEVLAVGDETFQAKCLDRIHEFQRQGRTIVVVSHAADLMRQICDRVAVLDHGNLVTYGAPGESIRVFRDTLFANAMERQAWLDAKASEEREAAEAAGLAALLAADADEGHERPPIVPHAQRHLQVRIDRLDIEHPHSEERTHLLPGEPLTLRLAYTAVQPTPDVVFALTVFDRDGKELYGASTEVLDVEVPTLVGSGEVLFEFDAMPLLDGTYPVSVVVRSMDEGTTYDRRDDLDRFSVMNPDRRVGVVALPLRVKITP